MICFQCELTRQVKVPFADPRRTYTHAFERYALELSKPRPSRTRPGTWTSVGTSSRTSRSGILQRRFGKPKLKNLKEIAIDEIAIGKGHRYFTVVLDLRSGAVVFVGDGKGAEALTAFWKRLRGARAKVKAVATDMGKAYIRAVREQPAQGGPRLRSLPRHQAVQRQAQRLSPRTVSRIDRRPANARSSRARAGCS